MEWAIPSAPLHGFDHGLVFLVGYAALLAGDTKAFIIGFPGRGRHGYSISANARFVQVTTGSHGITATS